MRALALGFVAGTFGLQQAAELPPSSFTVLAVAPLLACLLRVGCFRATRIVLLVLSGAIAGAGLAAWRAELRLAEALPHSLEGRDVSVTGVVSELPHRAAHGTRFVFQVEEGPPEVPRRISLTWYAERSRDGAIPPPSLRPGERWILTVRLKRPRGLANPHGFDFEAWALERAIRATGYVRAKPPAERAANDVAGWPQTLHRWRDGVRENMLERLGDKPFAGVLVALAIGDQAAIAAAQWETFWRTGVGHLMSISGLHITMLAELAFGVVFAISARVPLLVRRVPARKIAAVVGVLAALAYTLMTGFAVPAQRTLVMLGVVAGCVVTDRHTTPSRVLALAALAVLGLDPWAVLTVGFWLSFGAVAAIFFAAMGRTGRAGMVGAAAREQLAVTVAMLPMLIGLFQEVSLISPLANAFAIPLVSMAVVPLTLAGAFLDLVAALEAAHALLALGMTALGAMAAWPFATLESHAPPAWGVAAALIGAAWLLAPRGVPMRSCGLVWMAPILVATPMRPAAGEAWIDVLDVGNGLAVVVRTASRALAYDAGPSWHGDSDAGGRIVVPFLRGEGLGRLDVLVISHADDDHYGGAFTVAAARAPQLLVSPLPANDPLHLMAARSERCEAGRSWTWDAVRFTVLHPASAAYDDVRRRENDRSCVVRISTRGGAMLLTGDVEARAESEMVSRDRAALASHVLLAPHHGSRTSSTGAFLDAAAPTVAVFSVGHRNRHRHPHPGVVARYRERGIELHRTDREGALRVRLTDEPGGVTVRALVPAARYWSDRRIPP